MTVEFILYVSNQHESRSFYRHVLQREPVVDQPGMTSFALSEGAKLGLMPESGIAKIISHATVHPATGNGIPRCELYLHCSESPQMMKRALERGAKLISETRLRDWGHNVGYVIDSDGHIIAFATTAP
jgi:predicted enzyme related to lactoylglutathione lyase